MENRSDIIKSVVSGIESIYMIDDKIKDIKIYDYKKIINNMKNKIVIIKSENKTFKSEHIILLNKNKTMADKWNNGENKDNALLEEIKKNGEILTVYENNISKNKIRIKNIEKGIAKLTINKNNSSNKQLYDDITKNRNNIKKELIAIITNI